MKKKLVKAILEKATSYEWSLQGFGMLRMYLEPEVRLHIWDTRYQITDVSNVHTHPWNFKSTVIAGIIENINYVETDGLCGLSAMKYYRELIVTGEQATAVRQNNTVLLCLSRESSAQYSEGMEYDQEMSIPHMSVYHSGTVTIIERDSRTEKDHAYSYWGESGGPDGWVSAAPRPATDDEVNAICVNALGRWF